MANPVSLKTNNWVNSDGLFIPYGASEVTVVRVGEYDYDTKHVVSAVVALASLPLFNATTDSDVQILSDTVTIPNGALIEGVTITILKAITGSNANLDFGLVDQDRTTEIDFDGLLVAWDNSTALGTIEVLVKGGQDIGALVGTKLTNTGLLTARADTADFTAGVVRLDVFYSVPLAADL